MRAQSYIFTVLVVVLVFGGIGYAIMMPQNKAPSQSAPDETLIASFQACADAGNPIMESYPRQCRTKDGRSFTEEIAIAPAPAPTPTPPPVSDVSALIVVDAPLANSTIESPLSIKGMARGTWYFEASFPLELLDANGNRLAMMPVQADGEWMTEDFVPFSATLTWATSTTPTGTLVFHRDNPSGLPEHDKELRIPVILQ